MRYSITSLFLFFLSISIAQDIQLSGYIQSSHTGEILSAAIVYLDDGTRHTTSNEYGYYHLQVPQEATTLYVSYLGYETYQLEITFRKDTLIDIELEELALQTVEVVSSKILNEQHISTLDIPLLELQKLPNIGGEADVLKSLAIYPGVALGAEGNSNLYVRGGTPDQNLILLDGIPVYNASHLGGYLSVFNTDALRSVKLIKGGYPARYGGRLSSILDIKMKEGNRKKRTGNIGLGILASKFLIEGPIQKKRSSFVLTARNSYLGLVNAFRKKDKAENYFNYWLYDVNAKANFELKEGDLFISYYTGKDVGTIKATGGSSAGGIFSEKYTDEDNIKWGNSTFSARYIRPLSNKLFLKTILGYTRYQYSYESNTLEEFFGLSDVYTESSYVENQSILQSFIGDIGIDYTPSHQHYIRFGINLDHQRFKLSNEDFTTNISEGLTFSSYVEDDYSITDALSLNAGLRFSIFDTKNKTYTAFEPRLGLSYQLNNYLSITSSYTQMTQYLHLLSSASFGFPNDIWVSANHLAPPEKAKQISIGLFANSQKKHEFQIEAFYKKLEELIEYRTGNTDFTIDLNKWEEQVVTGGTGEVYGLEIYQKSKFKKLTTTFSYTLSWNYRQFNEINQGRRFPFLYDRRHDFSALALYNFNKKWWLSINWIYQTGRRVTLPVALLPEIYLDGTGQNIYPHRNNGILPAYHRLDVALNHEKKTKKGYTFGWNLSVYNLYNQINPSYIYIRNSAVFDDFGAYSHSEKSIRQVSLFPIIPSFSIYLKF